MDESDLIRGFTPEVAEALADAVHRAPAGSVLALDWDETCISGDVGDAAFWGLALDMQYAFDSVDFWAIMGKGDELEMARLAVYGDDGHALCDAMIRRYESILESNGPMEAYIWQTRVTTGLRPMQLKRRLFTTLRKQAGRAPDILKLKNDRRIRWGFRLKPAVAELARIARKRRMQVVVVSVSLREAVWSACRLLGFHEHTVLGNATCVRRGKLSGDLIEPVIYGRGKLDALRKATGQNPWIAIGDSDFDLPLLAGAEKLAVLLEPADAALIEQAGMLRILVEPRSDGAG